MNFEDKVLLKIEEMETYLNELEDLMPSDENTYIHDLKIKRACEKTIELAIETVIDIISIIVSYRKLGVPQDEDSLIDILKDNKVISNSLAKRIKEMKGFRNILIHKYGHVDDKLVYRFITNEIKDFFSFSKEIRKNL